jgi:hydroxyacylglutathione hydrolase
MRLCDRVFLTLSGDSGCSLSHPRDCNAYAVDCGSEVVLIDAGVGRQTNQILSNLEEDGVDPRRITTLLLTHAHLDHAGGARWLEEKLDLKIIASKEASATINAGDEDAISLPAAKRAGIYDQEMTLPACSAARGLNGGESWTLGDLTVRAVPCPGHSQRYLPSPATPFFMAAPLRCKTFQTAILRNIAGACENWRNGLSMVSSPAMEFGHSHEAPHKSG